MSTYFRTRQALYRNAINIGKYYWVDNRREWPTQLGNVSISGNMYNPHLGNKGPAKLQLIYDDIRIYNYALSPIEIQNLYSELNRACTDEHDIENDCDEEINKAFTKGALLGGAATVGALVVTGGLAAAAFGFWKKKQQCKKSWQENSNKIKELEILSYDEFNVSDVSITTTDHTYKSLSINT